jgi:hypothetical protein
MMTPQDLNRAFIERLFYHGEFQKVLRIVKTNSEGKVWLIGGFLYKTLAGLLYDYKPHIKDFDFIIEKVKFPLTIPEAWEELKTSYNNPKLKRGDLILDLVPLNNIHSIQRRNLNPSIENYLSGTPLTVQSIAFDIDSQEMMGEIGLKSLFDKVIAINNREEYIHSTDKYGEVYSIQKAKELSFDYSLKVND